MRDTYKCRQCGFTSETGAGSKPATCPECGGDQLTLRPGRKPPAKPAPKAPASEPVKEGP